MQDISQVHVWSIHSVNASAVPNGSCLMSTCIIDTLSQCKCGPQWEPWHHTGRYHHGWYICSLQWVPSDKYMDYKYTQSMQVQSLMGSICQGTDFITSGQLKSLALNESCLISTRIINILSQCKCSPQWEPWHHAGEYHHGWHICGPQWVSYYRLRHIINHLAQRSSPQLKPLDNMICPISLYVQM